MGEILDFHLSHVKFITFAFQLGIFDNTVETPNQRSTEMSA